MTLHVFAEEEILLQLARPVARDLDLAQAFGISQSQVSNIVRGASWSHLGLGRAS